jgi:hypothetical protein
MLRLKRLCQLNDVCYLGRHAFDFGDEFGVLRDQIGSVTVHPIGGWSFLVVWHDGCDAFCIVIVVRLVIIIPNSTLSSSGIGQQ